MHVYAAFEYLRHSDWLQDVLIARFMETHVQSVVLFAVNSVDVACCASSSGLLLLLLLDPVVVVRSSKL